MQLFSQQVVRDGSSLVLFKVQIRTLAKKLGFSSQSMEDMQIVASEMLSNQLKYANKTGMIQLWFHRSESNDCPSSLPVTIDLFAMDYGPGIKDIQQAFLDGYTTSKTMGKGLGSVARMTHEFDMYTLSDNNNWHGVALWGRFYLSKNDRHERFQLGQFIRAYNNMAENGDELWLRMNSHQLSCLHIDASGHGAEAEKIIQKITAVNDIHGQSCKKMLDLTERALHDTAGAAALALKYDVMLGQVEYCAVGDMRIRAIEFLQQQLIMKELSVSSGILGYAARSYYGQEFTLGLNDLILSTSDGIRRNWTLNDFPALWDRHPQLICFILGNQKGRSSDDQSIIALKRIK